MKIAKLKEGSRCCAIEREEVMASGTEAERAFRLDAFRLDLM